MTTIRKNMAVVAIALVCLCSSAFAASRGEVADRLEQYRKFFVDFQYAPDAGVPSDLLAECHGVIIMRQYKAGFVFGLKGGDGVIFLHDRVNNTWSAPGFVRTAEGSFGLQVGGQAVDAIILIMNQSGVDMLLRSRFKIGVDASAAAGPIGRDVSAKVGPGTALLTYSRSKGLFAGAAFEGGAILNNDAYNQVMYGRGVGLREILIERRVSPPAEAGPLHQALQSYSVRTRARPDANAGTSAPGVNQRSGAYPSPAPSSVSAGDNWNDGYGTGSSYQGGYGPTNQQYNNQQYNDQQYNNQQYNNQQYNNQQYNNQPDVSGNNAGYQQFGRGAYPSNGSVSQSNAPGQSGGGYGASDPFAGAPFPNDPFPGDSFQSQAQPYQDSFQDVNTHLQSW